MYHGDIRLGNTVDIKFTTVDTTGAPTTLAGTPVVSAYPGNSVTEITAGITLTVDFDARTGLHNVKVVASSGNGYATATNYTLVITTGTVGGTSVVGYVVGSFSVENREVNVTRVAGTAQTAGDILGDTNDIQARLPATLVGGRIDSSVGAMAADVVTAAAIALDAANEIIGAVSGTADSGTTTTVVDAERTEADTDYWKGSLITFTSGTLNGQTRLVTAFNAATDTITFAPATTVAVGTHTYRLLPAGRADVHLWLGTLVNALTSGRVDASMGAIAVGVIAAASFAANAIDASALATDAVNEIRDAILTDATRFPGASLTEARLSELDAATAGKMANQVDVIEVDTTSLNDTKIPDTLSLANINAEVDSALVDGGLVQVVTTIATLASQTSFTLTAGSADNSAYIGCLAVITDATTATQKARGVISAYTGATKTVTLREDPAVFTMAATDKIVIVSVPKDILDILADVTGLNGDSMRGTNSAALASVVTEARLSELDPGTAGKMAAEVDLIKTEANKIALADAGAGVAGSVIEEVENRTVPGDAMALTSAERDSVAVALLDLSGGIEVGLTLRQAIRLLETAAAGKLSGAGTATISIRNAVADTKTRITATVDADGNRSAITYDLTS